jgi:hypothetical protein
MGSGPAWVVLSGWPTRIEAGGGIDVFADRSNQGAAKDRVRRGV